GSVAGGAPESATPPSPSRVTRRPVLPISTVSVARTALGGPDPAAVGGMMRTDELEEGRAAFGILVEGSLERGDHIGRLAHVLAVVADRTRHRCHARRPVVGHLPRVWIVARSPEPRSIARIAAVVDVDGREADLVARDCLEVAH